MAVHRRSYRPYSGATTAPAWRFLVLARYAAMDLFESRLVVLFLVLAYVPLLIECGLVFVANNGVARALLGMQGASPLSIDAAFFLGCVRIQGVLAFVLAATVGPGLIAPDLANGALPLYLSRPFSRTEYVAGKMAVLLGLLSLVTWVPSLAVYFLQAGLADDWLGAHWRLGRAILLGSLLWISVLGLMALALSALVRRRLVASLLMCALFFVGMPFGEIWRNVMGNMWGRLANLIYLIGIVWRDLFSVTGAVTTRNGRVISELPYWAALGMLLFVCAASLWLLERRVRAREIVR
jgi:ABC-2 type transport system permease protein